MPNGIECHVSCIGTARVMVGEEEEEEDCIKAHKRR